MNILSQQASHDCVPKIPRGGLKAFWNKMLLNQNDFGIKCWRY